MAFVRSVSNCEVVGVVLVPYDMTDPNTGNHVSGKSVYLNCPRSGKNIEVVGVDCVSYKLAKKLADVVNEKYGFDNLVGKKVDLTPNQYGQYIFIKIYDDVTGECEVFYI